MLRKIIGWCLFVLMASAFMPFIHECQESTECPPEKFILTPITQTNPALDWSVRETGTEADPFAAFDRFPLDEPFSVPVMGGYLDEERETPHFGVDFTDATARFNGDPKPVYPIGPGIVTTLHPCLPCWADSDDPRGQIRSRQARYNFGFGTLVLIEHPYNEYVSFYSLYSHLRNIHVSAGQRVDSEISLGLMGASGDAAEAHVHLEIRYGPPGDFWGADFSSRDDVDRWLATKYDTPNFLLYPQHHLPFVRVLEKWVRETYPAQSQ